MPYLMHFNKNHSKVNGQFVSGDGDSDGVIDDHHNYKKNKITNPDGTNIKTSIKNQGSNGKNLYKYLKKNKLKYRYSLDVGSLEDRRNRYKTISENFGISDAIKDKKLTKSYTNYINSIIKAQKIDKEATDAAIKGDTATYLKLEQKAQKASNKISGLEKKYDEDVSRVAKEIIGKYSNKKLSKEYKYSEAVEQIIRTAIYEHI